MLVGQRLGSTCASKKAATSGATFLSLLASASEMCSSSLPNDHTSPDGSCECALCRKKSGARSWKPAAVEAAAPSGPSDSETPISLGMQKEMFDFLLNQGKFTFFLSPPIERPGGVAQWLGGPSAVAPGLVPAQRL